jgi:hypothetical protein
MEKRNDEVDEVASERGGDCDDPFLFFIFNI